MPVFTQRAPEHDVVVAADETEVFAAHLPYHTWDPRPVAGSAGLEPATWHPGAGGLGRHPAPDPLREAVGPADAAEDYNVWMALRVLGEAATRTQGADLAAVRDYILGPRLRARGLQGPAGDLPRLGRPAAPADPARRRPAWWSRSRRRRSSCTRSRRSTPSGSTEPETTCKRSTGRRHAHRATRHPARLDGLAASPALADTIFVSNEKGNTITRPRQRDAGGHPRRSRRSSGRAASPPRPDGKRLYICASDDNHVRVMDAETCEDLPSLPSGPDPELCVLHPSRQPALRRQRGRQPRHRRRRRDAAGAGRDAGRHRARGHGREPRRQDRGQHLRDHQHGAFHRHRELRDRSPTCWSTRGRASPSSPTTAACSTSRPRSAARSA